MTQKPVSGRNTVVPAPSGTLRERAMAMVKKTPALDLEQIKVMSAHEVLHIVSELTVHQVELEIQNEELRQAQVAIEEARTRYLDLYHSAPVGYCTLDDDAIIIEANQTLATLLGKPLAALEKIPFSKLVVRLDQDSFYLFFRHLQTEGQARSCEVRILGDREVYFWAVLEAIAVNREEGRPEFRVVIHDVSERRRATNAVRRAEEHFRTLFENNLDGILLATIEGSIFAVNAAACEILAYSEAELTHMSWQRLVATPSLPLNLFLASKDHGQVRADLVFRHSDGTLVECEVSGALHIDPENVRTAILTLKDVTRQRKAQRELKESDQRLQLALRAADVGLWDWKLDTNQAFYSPEWKKQLGISDEEITDHIDEWISRLHPTDREPTLTSLQQFLKGEKPKYTAEYRLLHKDGSWRWIEARADVIRSDQGMPVRMLGSHIDITEKKHKVDELAKAEERLLQAQKLESIGQLAGGVAHDFNNIMAAMMMQLELLQMDAPQEDTATHEALADLTKEAKRAAELTRQLLMFSRRSVFVVKTIDLNAVIANLLKMLNRFIREDITLTFEAASTLLVVEADVNMLEQVLLNLVVNARDAMPKGGRLTIRTTMKDFSTEHSAEHVDGKTGRFVCMSVADTGQGMSAQTMKRVFEPFFTTKEMGKGTGLGLATVHGIMAQHKGWIDVESTIGVGTTFYAYFPAIAQTQHTEPDSKPSMTPPIVGRETILLVEDDKLVRNLVAKTLRRLGYSVYEAIDGTEALCEWDKHKSEIDLLLTDVVLPGGMTGLEIVDKLREQKPSLKVIVTSGYCAEMSQLGAGDIRIMYLPKPYETQLLVDTLRKCLNDTTDPHIDHDLAVQ